MHPLLSFFLFLPFSMQMIAFRRSKCHQNSSTICESFTLSFCSLKASSVRSHQSSQAPYPLFHTYTCTHFSLTYLQPVWYLGQMCDPRLLVDEFPFIQITKLGPIKAHSEISSKHPLMSLEGNKHTQIDTNQIFLLCQLSFVFFNYKGDFEGFIKSQK